MPGIAAAHMHLAAVDTAAPAPVVPTEVPATPAPAQAANNTSAVRQQVMGTVTLPRSITGLANAHDGVVSGARVEILSVNTGRHLAQGVTYYDGSYSATLPDGVGKCPAEVQVMLVGEDHKDLFPLAAALQLRPEQPTARANVDAASTAWLALLCRLAAVKANVTAPTWTSAPPGDGAKTLGGMITGTQDDAANAFGLLAGPQLARATTADQLQRAIQGVVTDLVTAKASSR